MPETARRHFDEDIARAEALAEEGWRHESDGHIRLATDVRSAAIAMSAGALDAYLCDAYVDCLARALRAYFRGEWNGALPAFYAKQRLPAGELLDNSRTIRPLWSIRMAARKVMEREDMLNISRLNDHFNPILPPDQKVWADFLPMLFAHRRKRFTGPLMAEEIAALEGQDRTTAMNTAIAAVKKRLGGIIQIRHDWIHNCGRPRVAIVTYTHGEATARVRDIRDFVEGLDDHLETHRFA